MSAVDSRVRSALERLVEKSRKDEVLWRESHNDAYVVEMSSKDAHGLQVAVEYWTPDIEPDSVVVRINYNGREVFRHEALDGTEEFDFYRSLYEEARRSVIGWDAALDILDSEVSKEGIIGNRPEPNLEFSGDVPF